MGPRYWRTKTSTQNTNKIRGTKTTKKVLRYKVNKLQRRGRKKKHLHQKQKQKKKKRLARATSRNQLDKRKQGGRSGGHCRLVGTGCIRPGKTIRFIPLEVLNGDVVCVEHVVKIVVALLRIEQQVAHGCSKLRITNLDWWQCVDFMRLESKCSRDAKNFTWE